MRVSSLSQDPDDAGIPGQLPHKEPAVGGGGAGRAPVAKGQGVLIGPTWACIPICLGPLQS